MQKKIFILLILVIQVFIGTAQNKTSSDTVVMYFQEIKANTNHYKKLWNKDLYGPILLVDPKSSKVYANFPDSTGILKQDSDIFTGILPIAVNIANTAINWSGKLWAMIMLPLPGNKNERLDLLSHELFHRSQPLLGFKMNNPANNHLDQKDGRVYLRLELEALRQALLGKTKSEVKRNLTDALSFRNLRYSVYPNAKSSENSLELNEGLATYTGIFMSGRSKRQMKEYFQNKLTDFQNYPSFVRSFAYVTTPLYGTLLTRSYKYWNKQIDNKTNLTDFFVKSFNLSVPEHTDAEILNQYGFGEIDSIETKREESIKQLTAEYKAKFIEQPHLVISLEKMSISFNPRNMMPLEGFGTVYPTLRVSDNWGILTVTDGALLSAKWDKITLSEPASVNSGRVTGNGWTLDLNKGYTVEKNISDSNYSLKKFGISQ